MKDKEKLPVWLREAAVEIERAHRQLDAFGVPDCADDGTPISLALRISVGIETARVEQNTGSESDDSYLDGINYWHSGTPTPDVPWEDEDGI